MEFLSCRHSYACKLRSIPFPRLDFGSHNQHENKTKGHTQEKYVKYWFVNREYDLRIHGRPGLQNIALSENARISPSATNPRIQFVNDARKTDANAIPSPRNRIARPI